MPSAKRLYQISQAVSGVFLLGIAISLHNPVIAAPAETANETVVDSGYLLGAGDQVEISVYGYQEFTGPRTVLPDGTVSLPVVGSVVAANRTPAEFAAELKTRLNPFLVDPVVTVSLATLRPVIVNVAGEVQRPGPIQLRSLTTTTFRSTNNTVTSGLEGVPTLSSALMEAGGVTQNANIQQVVLRRTLPGGKTTNITVNLWDAIWSDRQPEDLMLRAGDSIFVPKLENGTTLNRRLLARSRLSPATVRVRVAGEVTKPGEIQISPDSTMSSAVASAGGFTKEARANAVQLVRLNDNGQIVTQQIDLSKLNDRLQVQEGDVVIVPERNRSSFLRVLGQVLNPFSSLLNIFRGF